MFDWRRTIGVITTLTMAFGGVAAQATTLSFRQAAIASGRVGRSAPFFPRAELATRPQDPADSLYREARGMLNRGNYTRSAYLFGEITERHPRSSYAPDAYYWGAYALSRTGSTASLNRALGLIRQQAGQHPKASTRRSADELAHRIRGQLARRGDAESAREVARLAGELADAGRESAREERELARQLRRNDQASQERCRDEDDERIAALNALLQMDSDRALPILERVMARRDAGSVCLRRKAVFMVSQQRGTRAGALLLSAVRSDPDQAVREQAVFWLSQVEGDNAVVALDSILRASENLAIREKAIFALSQHDSDRAASALREYAQRASEPSALREKAIFWLGQSGGDNTAFLRDLYGSVREEELKDKIIFALSQHGSPAESRWLLEIAANRSETTKLRKSAIFWAVQGGADLPELFALYDRTDEPEIKQQLIFAYSQSSDRAAIDRLLEIARRDPDRELRKKALFWLSQSEDPRVVDLLTEILETPK